MLSAYRKEEFQAIQSIIRHAAACSHGDYAAVTCLIEACYLAEECDLPERYLLPGLVTLKRAVREYGFGDDAIPTQFAPLVDKSLDLAAQRAAQLDLVGENLEQAIGCPTHQALLLGDSAILAGLYEDLGAFPSEHPLVAVPSRIPLPAGPSTSISLYPEIGPGQPAATLPEQSEAALFDSAEPVTLGSHRWLRPNRESLLVLLAAHLGDPQNTSLPTVWPHLGLGIKRWGREMPSRSLLTTGQSLGIGPQVAMGLAVASKLFPEIESWVRPSELGLSSLALKFTAPMTARRLATKT